MSKIKFIPQRDNMDCGPACLAMVSLFHGKKYSIEYLRSLSYITRDGVSLLGLKEASNKIGLDTISAKLSLNELTNKKQYLPCILYWNEKHFVVLYDIKSNKDLFFFIADPEFGKIKLSQKRFEESWLSKDNNGIALFLNPTERFMLKQPPQEKKLAVKYLYHYINNYRKQFLNIF